MLGRPGRYDHVRLAGCDTADWVNQGLTSILRLKSLFLIPPKSDVLLHSKLAEINAPKTGMATTPISIAGNFPYQAIFAGRCPIPELPQFHR